MLWSDRDTGGGDLEVAMVVGGVLSAGLLQFNIRVPTVVIGRW